METPTARDLAQRFRGTLTGALGEAELEALRRALYPRTILANDIVVREGELTGELLLVWEGSFLVAVTVDGARTEIGRCGPGDVIAEVSWIDGLLPTATVFADGPGTVLVLPRTAFDDIARIDPRIAAALLRALCRTLAGRVRSATAVFEGIELPGGATPSVPPPAPARSSAPPAAPAPTRSSTPPPVRSSAPPGTPQPSPPAAEGSGFVNLLRGLFGLSKR